MPRPAVLPELEINRLYRELIDVHGFQPSDIVRFHQKMPAKREDILQLTVSTYEVAMKIRKIYPNTFQDLEVQIMLPA